MKSLLKSSKATLSRVILSLYTLNIHKSCLHCEFLHRTPLASSVIKQWQAAPSPGSAVELTLPLTYFDFGWLTFHHMQRILFYKYPISKSSFVQTIIPNLKSSLSLTLKHYLPLAGNVVFPVNPTGTYPELRYVTGDMVSVTFSETDMDFNFLVGNHPRNAKDFYPLVRSLAEPKNEPGVQLAPLLAIQVTLFPDVGISIGFTNHHVAGDGVTIVGFIRAWALLNKFDGNEQFLSKELLPFYDRSVIKDPYDQRMFIWDIVRHFKLQMSDVATTPEHKVRSTFIMRRDDIVKLKNLVLSRRPCLTHVTSFTVTCAYVWICLIKSGCATEEEMDENVMEVFRFAADCRARFNPPLPPSYFGNCLVGYSARTRHCELAGEEGFIIAAELIGEGIKKRMKDEEWILTGEWAKEADNILESRAVSVAGSPKLDFYAADFGWGRPEKLEYVSIDNDRMVSMSLVKSRHSDGDLEVYNLCYPNSLVLLLYLYRTRVPDSQDTVNQNWIL